MKRMLLLLGLAGCTSSVAPLGVDELAKGMQLSAEQSRALHSAAAACPGMLEYSPDLRLTEVAVPPGRQTWDVVFQVNELPKLIPNEFKAFGQTCYIEVDGSQVVTTKKACASLCIRRTHPATSTPYELI